MCCAAEIAITIMGIVTLVKGKFTLTKRTIVYGRPAYIIGAILTATFPLALGIGIVLGVMMQMQNPGRKPDMLQFAWLDPLLVAIILILVSVIATSYRSDAVQKDLEPEWAPSAPPRLRDAGNPYASPEQASRPISPAPPLPPLGSGVRAEASAVQKRWYYSADGTSAQGPVSTDDLRRLIAGGTLTRESLVSQDGEQWHAAAELKGAVWPQSDDLSLG